MTTTTDPRANGYGALWRRTPGSIAYLFVSFLVTMVVMSVLWAVVGTGIGLVVLVVGLPILVLALMIARGTGSLERHLLGWTGLPAIAEPAWPAPAAGSWWKRVFAKLRSGHHWSYLAHQLLVAPIVSTFTFAISVTWWATTLGGLTFWFWQGFLPDRDPASDWPGWLANQFWPLAAWSSRAVESGLYLTAGIVFGATLPWVISGLTRLQHAIATAMLGRWPSDDLTERAQLEAAGRASAVHAEDTAMRRLERDLHDGPQQRLIRLQMDLAAAERRARAGEPEVAADYTRQAQAHAKAALEELRALSRGVAPPLLTDRGLRSALAALAEESPLPVHAELDPNLDQTVSPEVARAVYFVVAELFTNAVRHSGASRVDLLAQVQQGEQPQLHLAVRDDGHGGARLTEGHGLAGLAERVRGLLGVLTVESPDGGPTTVEVRVPTGQQPATWPSYPEA